MDEDEKVFEIEVGGVDHSRHLAPEGSEHMVRVWRGWPKYRTANTEHFTTEQLRTYHAALGVYLEGIAND